MVNTTHPIGEVDDEIIDEDISHFEFVIEPVISMILLTFSPSRHVEKSCPAALRGEEGKRGEGRRDKQNRPFSESLLLHVNPLLLDRQHG